MLGREDLLLAKSFMIQFGSQHFEVSFVDQFEQHLKDAPDMRLHFCLFSGVGVMFGQVDDGVVETVAGHVQASVDFSPLFAIKSVFLEGGLVDA